MPCPGTWGHVLAEIFSSEQWLSFFVIFPISLRPSLRLNLLIFLRAFLRLNQPFSTKLFFFHPVQQQNKRMFKFLCTNYFNFHDGIFCELRPAWGLFVWDPPLYSHSFLPRRSKAWVLTCPLVWQSCSQRSGDPLGFWSPNSCLWCLRAPSWGSHNCRAAPWLPPQGRFLL